MVDTEVVIAVPLYVYLMCKGLKAQTSRSLPEYALGGKGAYRRVSGPMLKSLAGIRDIRPLERREYFARLMRQLARKVHAAYNMDLAMYV